MGAGSNVPHTCTLIWHVLTSLNITYFSVFLVAINVSVCSVLNCSCVKQKLTKFTSTLRFSNPCQVSFGGMEINIGLQFPGATRFHMFA